MAYAALHAADGNLLLPFTVDGKDADPFWVTGLDLGAVTVREDVEDDPSGDGTRDYTSLSGASGVTVSLTAKGNDQGGPYYWLGKLGGLMQPSKRPYLHVQIDDWPEMRRILLRADELPRDLTVRKPDVQVQWKAPQGWMEALVDDTVQIQPTGATLPGLAEPISFPVAWPPASSTSSPIFTVGGEANAWPTWDIYGPCTAPLLTDIDGRKIAFKGDYTVPDGHFVRVQPRAPGGPIVAYDGDPTVSHYNAINFAQNSAWWPLAPGENRVVFNPASFGRGAHVVGRWRPRW